MDATADVAATATATATTAMFDNAAIAEAAAAVLSLTRNVTEQIASAATATATTMTATTTATTMTAMTTATTSSPFAAAVTASVLSQLKKMILPFSVALLVAMVLCYGVLMLFLMNTDHTVLSLLKMNVLSTVCYSEKRPPVAPFGMIACVHKMTSDQQPWFPLEAKKALGGNTDTFILPLPRRPVMTGDYALARQILCDPLTTKPKTYREFEPLGIGSMFTRNGSFWHARRKGAAPAFANKHIRRMGQVALECTEKWIEEVLLPCAREGRSFDVSREMISVTLEAICKTAFEYDISKTEQKVFVDNLELQFKEFLCKSVNNPFRKYLGRLLPGRRRALRAAQSNVALAKRIIARYRANPDPIKGTIVDHLANNTCYANEDELVADLLLFLSAGHDTTAYTLAFTLLQLAKYPHEQKKVRDEIFAEDETSSNESSSSNSNNNNNNTQFFSWKRSGALQRSIKESMRLFPVSASGSARLCGRDFVTKEGWIIPKGTCVVNHIMMTHRNQSVFGPDADEYKPDRWKDPTRAQKESFLLFSAGKQNCIGQSLAQAEMHCMVPRILSEVELEIDDPGSITWFLTLKPIGCKLRPRLKQTITQTQTQTESSE